MNKLFILIIIIIILNIYYFYNDTENYENHNTYKNKWSKLDKKARNNYDCNPIKIINNIHVVKNTCEGLPHTQNNNIIIPEKYWNNSNPINDIIKHENVHIHQKQNYQLWKDFYEKEWFYTLSNTPPANMPNKLIENYRINPDTFIEKWACFLNRYYSIPIYSNINNPEISNIKVVWWDSQTNTINNEPPHEWLSFFHKIQHLEHPNEISAVYLSTEKNNSMAYKKLTDKFNM